MFRSVISKISNNFKRIGAMVASILLVGSMSFGFADAAPSQGGFISASDAPSSVQASTGGTGDAKQLVKNIVDFFLGFLGFVTVLVIIYAGVIMVTSAGNEEKFTAAKKILTYAIIGIILILLSYAIVNTVFQAGTAIGN